MLPELILKHLAQRLQIEDWYRRHPEIDDEPIDAPLIGLGLPRTGSTALSILLAEDPDARSLRRWEAGAPCPPPSTVDGPDPRIAEAAGRAGDAGRALAADVGAGPGDADRARGVPGPDGARLQGPLLPGVRLRAVVLRVAARRRPDLHVPVRAPGPEAAAVGIADPAVAAEVPVAPAVARPPRRGVPRRPLRDDPSRPDRGDGLGRRRLRRGGPPVQRRDRPPLPGRAQRGALDGGHGTPAAVPRRARRRPLLRHGLPGRAARSDRPGAWAVRLAGASRSPDRSSRACAGGGRRTPSTGRRTSIPTPSEFGLDLDAGARPVRRVLGEDPGVDRRDGDRGRS